MKLKKYKVTEFRSVNDSGWIEIGDIAGLIGTNESGKTNLITPLWKLNPANGGDIDLIDDFPRKRYHQVKGVDEGDLPIFITASFELSDKDKTAINRATDIDVDTLEEVYVSRSYSGDYTVGFGGFEYENSVEKTDILDALEKAKSKLQSNEALMQSVDAIIQESDDLELNDILSKVDTLDTASILEIAGYGLSWRAGKLREKLKHTVLDDNKLAVDEALKLLPNFVYYSHYGNLDSEIYLPHVIDNLARIDELGAKETEKARTLKVLFDFVNLDPEEILDLGRDVDLNKTPAPTVEEIQEVTTRKKEREILLQSASTDITSKFKKWWRQGNYKIRFQADGDHFRIWVSDEVRVEEIELESRSTGLQWFFSFYLVFLVERDDEHENSILLLDEPGLSLHPLAQKDLSVFFESLSSTNQIVYTTHSPFLVDSNHLDRIKAVYVDDNGHTLTSPNLRAGNKETTNKSIYPVHAALGLTVSDIIFEGCLPILVEGPSDQHYLTMIKNYLISKGKLKPQRDIIFIPAGGTKGIKAVTPIISGKANELPIVLIDSDAPGEQLKKHLSTSLYESQKDRLVSVSDFCEVDGAEVEDLIPGEWLANLVARQFKGPEDDFDDVYEEGKNIVDQIEGWANNYEFSLPSGWKVDLAKIVKQKFLKKPPTEIDENIVEQWKKLFMIFIK